MTQETKNNVTITYNSEKVVLESETRIVRYTKNNRGSWTIELEDKTRETNQGFNWNLGIKTNVTQNDMLIHLDKKQYELGFFIK